MKKIKNFENFISESVHPLDTNDPLKSINTVYRGLRKLSYHVMRDFDFPGFTEVYDELMQNPDYRVLPIEGENKPFIIYHKDKQKEAEEMKELAERFNGYLHCDAPLHIQKRFGEILEYHPEEIEKYIQRRRLEGIKESFKLPILLALATSLNIKSSGMTQRQLVDTIEAKTTEFDDYTGTLEEAKKALLRKIERNENILNKDELKNRIQNLDVREYKGRTSSAIMYYFWDKSKDKDIVYINKSRYNKAYAYNTFVHELNHLVDQHKKTKTPVKASQVINKASLKDFENYFSEWRPLRGKNDFFRKPINMGILLGRFFKDGPGGYAVHEDEMYARLSSLREFLVSNGLMQEDEKMQKKHVDRIKDWVNQKYPQTDDIQIERDYDNFMSNDFILILPLINWECVDYIDLIVKTKNKENEWKV